MLKKVSKLTVLFCMLVFAGSAFAQNEVPEYPQYGFWSNWSIGPTISFDYQPDVNFRKKSTVEPISVSAITIPHGSPNATKVLTRTKPVIGDGVLQTIPSRWIDTVLLQASLSFL